MRNRYHRCLKIVQHTHTFAKKASHRRRSKQNQNQIRKIKLSSTIPHKVGISLTGRRFQQSTTTKHRRSRVIRISSIHTQDNHSYHVRQPKSKKGKDASPPFIFFACTSPSYCALRHHITYNHLENQGRSPSLLDHSASKQTVPCQSITSQERFSSENDSCVLPADRTPKVPAGIAGHHASNASVRSVGTSEPSTKVKDSEDT